VALTPAERARRSRSHRRGDHALCDPARCDLAPVTTTGGVTVEVTTSGDVTVQADPAAAVVLRGRDLVEQLGPRGRQLWAELRTRGMTPAARALAVEACRIVDRLEHLDRILAGDVDAWARLTIPIPEQVALATGLRQPVDGVVTVQVVLVVDGALAEARQQTTALRGLVAELRAERLKSAPQDRQEGGGLLERLAQQRQARRGAAAPD